MNTEILRIHEDYVTTAIFIFMLLRAAIDCFLRSLPLSKPFSTISDPTFTEAHPDALGHLQNTSEKQATSIRNGQKPISNEQR